MNVRTCSVLTEMRRNFQFSEKKRAKKIKEK